MLKHGIPKSHAQDMILDLVVETLADAYAALSSCDPSFPVRKTDLERDATYLRRRYQNEGITFLTKTLPSLGDWLDKYVWNVEELQRVVGFEPYNGLCPTFLRPFWLFLERLHDEEVQATEVEVYRILRTLLHGCKKLEVPYTKDQENKKIEQFLRIEQQLDLFDVTPQPELWYCQRVMDRYLSGYFPSCHRPRHGPGAVAGGERHNEKWNFSILYESVHAEFPYWEFMLPIRSAIGDLSGRPRALQVASHAKAYRDLIREKSPTAKLLLVPKDSRGPRVISCEPKELMYLQQGLSTDLMDYIESHSWTRGHVNFERQDINGSLALESSYSRSKDTIDLSDASDRVSCALVKFLTPKNVYRKWHALRSTATLLPDGRKVPLTKFAPMGSALCFPVESLVFWALAVGTVWHRTGDQSLALESVWVYGDDIIIAGGHTEAVMQTLESVALKVNRDKSFIGNHPFRESCGIDAFKGFIVTPSRIKKLPPRRSQDGTALVAWLKYAENDQYIMPRRSRYILDHVESLVGSIPRVPIPQSYLSIVTTENVWSHKDFQNLKWCSDLSYWKASVIQVKPRKHTSAIPDWARLQRNLIQRVMEGDPTRVVDRASTQISKRSLPITYLGLTVEA